MPFDPTKEQAAILAHPMGRHARVLAGPGTGKSATLVALVERLLAEDPPPRVRLLTFTRAATGELARKVAEHPTAAAERPSTIHSFAISVLLQNPGAGDFPHPLRIVDDWEYRNVVRPRLASRIGATATRVDRLVREMAANWESLRPNVDSRMDADTRGRFLGAWHEQRRTYGYTLVAELPYALRSALLEHPDLGGLGYDLIIVDEYQDLNACDLEVLRLIAARGVTIIAAGDDDQSIYSFRRAAPEGIRRFPDDYPACADYPLSVTQRCGRRIVEWADYVIRGDPDRPRDKPPLTSIDGAPEGDAALLAFDGEQSEATGIAMLVQMLIEDEGIPPSEILVLHRADHADRFSEPIRAELERLHIPCADPDAVDDVFAEPGNRQLLEVLRILVSREDSIAWASLVRLTPGLGERFVTAMEERGKGAEASRFGATLLQAHAEGFPGVAPAQVARGRALVASVVAWCAGHPVPDEEPGGGWGPWILGAAGSDIAPQPSDALRAMLAAPGDAAEPQSLGRYLGQLGPLAKDRARTESAGVRLMTIQAAKGLTVRATIVAAAEEGIIPRPGDRGEERRLLYVAMTRPRHFLFCTWARRRRGPTARAGEARVALRRRPSSFFDGGPITTQDGAAFLRNRRRRR